MKGRAGFQNRNTGQWASKAEQIMFKEFNGHGEDPIQEAAGSEDIHKGAFD